MELCVSSRKKMYVIAVYRPPKSNFDYLLSQLDTALSALPGQSRHMLCLVGDFNARCSSWWSGQHSLVDGSCLESFASVQGLVQVVDGPTRAVGSPQAAQLDLMFVRDAALVQSCCILPPVADHCPIVMRLSVSRSCAKVSRSSFLNFARADIPALIDHLHGIDWSAVHASSDPSSALNSWLTVV